MSLFRRYLVAQKRKKKDLFLILLKGLSFVAFLILGENLLLFPEAHKRSTKVHLNFMQSGLPLKLYTSRQMQRWGVAGVLSKTHALPLLTWIAKEEGKEDILLYPSKHNYICITIHIRYANQFGIIH